MLTQFKSGLGLKSKILSRSATINFGFLNFNKHTILKTPDRNFDHNYPSLDVPDEDPPYRTTWLRFKYKNKFCRKNVIPRIKMIKGQL